MRRFFIVVRSTVIIPFGAVLSTYFEDGGEGNNNIPFGEFFLKTNDFFFLI